MDVAVWHSRCNGAGERVRLSVNECRSDSENEAHSKEYLHRYPSAENWLKAKLFALFAQSP